MKKILSLVLALVMVFATVSMAFAETIKYGDEGTDVKHIQSLLKQYGYYTEKKLSGVFDKITLNAVKQFQKYNKLTVDGKVGEKTLFYLETEEIAQYAPVKDETGNKGEVKYIQDYLKEYEYYTGNIDGIYGPNTKAAVKAFQTANGLKADGIVGPDTLAKLESGEVVKKTEIGTKFEKMQLGSKSELVKNVQKQLWSLGYYDGNWSGVFDNKMWLAVKEFQKDNGLKVDGIIGKATWAALTGLPSDKNEVNENASNAVKEIQQRLADLGWYDGPIDGKNGAATIAAIKSFQQVHGLKVDGVVGTETRAKLFGEEPITKPEADFSQSVNNHPTVQPNVKGTYVTEIQKLLQAKGYYAGKLDGKFGPATLAAVKAFQADNGLEVDGKVGRMTWAALLQ